MNFLASILLLITADAVRMIHPWSWGVVCGSAIFTVFSGFVCVSAIFMVYSGVFVFQRYLRFTRVCLCISDIYGLSRCVCDSAIFTATRVCLCFSDIYDLLACLCISDIYGLSGCVHVSAIFTVYSGVFVFQRYLQFIRAFCVSAIFSVYSGVFVFQRYLQLTQVCLSFSNIYRSSTYVFHLYDS